MAVRLRFALITTMLGVTVTGGCPGPDGGGRQPPRLMFGSTARDVGHVRQGDPVAASFAFRNEGDLPLVVEPPRPGCDCEAVTAARVVAPGAESTVELRCSTMQTAGAFSRTVTVYANDPGQPATTLTLSADVQPVAIADPPALYLGHVRRDQDIATAIKLLAPRGSRAVFGPVDVDGRVVRTMLGALPPRETPPDMRGIQLRLRIDPDAPPGPFAVTMRVATDEEAVPVLTIEVAGIVDGAVVVSPAELDFGRVAADAEETRVLEVRGTTDRAVTITGASMEPAVGRVDTEAVQPGRAYRVTARLQGSALRPLPVGRLRGMVLLDTDAADTARLEVPFTARVVQR